MNKIDLVYGALIAIAAAFLGSWLFIELATPYGLIEGIEIMNAKGSLGKVLTLGAIFDVIAFFVLLRYKKELMARGVILGMITLTIITLFI